VTLLVRVLANNLKMLQPIRDHGYHLGFRIALKTNTPKMEAYLAIMVTWHVVVLKFLGKQEAMTTILAIQKDTTLLQDTTV
jgi:hypothetical protein